MEQVVLIKFSSYVELRVEIKTGRDTHTRTRALGRISRFITEWYERVCRRWHTSKLYQRSLRWRRYKIAGRSALVINSNKSTDGSPGQFASTLTHVFSMRQQQQSIRVLSQRHFGFCRTCPYLARSSADVNVIGRRDATLFASYRSQFIKSTVRVAYSLLSAELAHVLRKKTGIRGEYAKLARMTRVGLLASSRDLNRDFEFCSGLLLSRAD